LSRRALQTGVVLAVLVVAASSAAAADWSRWELYMTSAQLALDEGHLASAEQWLLDATREAERQDPRSPQLEKALRSLAAVYRKQGRPRDADLAEKRIAGLSGASTGTRDLPDVTSALDAYAAALTQLGRDRDAGAVTRRAQRLRSGVSSGDLLFFNPVADLREYVRLLRQQNRDDEAHTIGLLAAAEAGKLVVRYDTLRQTLSSRSALPSLTWLEQTAAGDEAFAGRLYPEAEALYADAVKTGEKFGPADVRLGYSLSMLAAAAKAQRKSSEFTAAVRRAMAIFEKAAGSGESLLAFSLAHLALAHLRFDFDPATTLPHFQQSLRILEKDVARDHPAIGVQLAGIAACHVASGQPAAATPHRERALAIGRLPSRQEHRLLAYALLRLADQYDTAGDAREAEMVVGEVSNILRRTLDAGHPDVIAVDELRRDLQRKTTRPLTSTALAQTATIPIQLRGNAMLVHATINAAQDTLLIVDTGAAMTSLRPLVLTRLGVSLLDAPRRRIYVVGGRSLEVPFVTVSLRVGDVTIDHLEVAVTEAGDPDIDGLLGADVLGRFKVALDRPGRRMTLEPLAP